MWQQDELIPIKLVHWTGGVDERRSEGKHTPPEVNNPMNCGRNWAGGREVGEQSEPAPAFIVRLFALLSSLLFTHFYSFVSSSHSWVSEGESVEKRTKSKKGREEKVMNELITGILESPTFPSLFHRVSLSYTLEERRNRTTHFARLAHTFAHFASLVLLREENRINKIWQIENPNEYRWAKWIIMGNKPIWNVPTCNTWEQSVDNSVLFVYFHSISLSSLSCRSFFAHPFTSLENRIREQNERNQCVRQRGGVNYKEVSNRWKKCNETQL